MPRGCTCGRTSTSPWDWRSGWDCHDWGLARGWPFADKIDPLVALVLGVYLIGVAFRIVRPTLAQFLDTSLPPEEIEEIAASLSEYRHNYVEVHAIRARRSGMERHVDIHLLVPPDTTVQGAHDLAHRVEEHLARAHPGTQLLVHIEPAGADAMTAYIERGSIGAVFETDPDEVATGTGTVDG